MGGADCLCPENRWEIGDEREIKHEDLIFEDTTAVESQGKGSDREASAAQSGPSALEELLVRIAGRHRDPDPADGDSQERPDLQ